MAELNLKQIVDKLNTEFTGDTRKLIFWYDEKGEFAEDINSLELANAKIYIMFYIGINTMNCQFMWQGFWMRERYFLRMSRKLCWNAILLQKLT